MMINILQVLEILNLELVVGKHLASHDSDMPYLQQEVKQNKQEGKLRNHLLFEKINSRHIKKGFVSTSTYLCCMKWITTFIRRKQ